MLRNLLIGILTFFFLSTAWAVDLKGKIGFGAGWLIPAPQDEYGLGLGLLSPNVVTTRIGLSSRIVIEPNFQILSVANDEKASAFILRGLFDYAFLEHEKTNISPKIGFEFATSSEGGATLFSGFGLPLGIGLEHWLSEHFSIDLTTISGIYFQTEPHKATTFTLGNTALTVCLIWYY
ncbi:MAG: DUF2715 domain-containing protein [candidate division WOR-3 bacterium]